jgi:hypothetical protein
MRALVLAFAAASVVACGQEPSDGTAAPAAAPALSDRTIRPGEGIGPLRLGMRYAEARAILGDGETIASQRLGFARYPSLGLELVLATPMADAVTPDSRVIAIGARGPGDWRGTPRPGDRREDVVRALGTPDRVGERDFFAKGAAVQYASPDASDAIAVAVFASWTERPTP